MVVLKTPPRVCVELIEVCGRRGIDKALIWSSGFSELGADGHAPEAELAEAARRTGVTLLGPNTNENAFEPLYQEGPGGCIGLVSQSGHNGRPLAQGARLGARFSRWFTTGNEADLDLADIIEFYPHDTRTSVVAAFAEGFRSGEKLRRAFAAAKQADMPFVILKMGATQGGAQAAVSHTGHLAGSDAVVQGLFDQYGVTRVGDLDELLETANLFSKLAPGVGDRMGLYTISGGSAALMSEVASGFELPIPNLSAATQAFLHQHIPAYLSVANPIDSGATWLMRASAADRRAVLDAVAADPAIDLLVVGITGALGDLTDRMADDVIAFAAETGFPVVVTWNSLKDDEPGYARLRDSGLPLFRSFRNRFRALDAYRTYQQRRAEPVPRPLRPQGAPLADADDIGGRLRTHGVVFPESRLVTGVEAARSAAATLRFPIVVKLESDDIPHKSDGGFVKLGVASADEAAAAAKDMLTRAAALPGPPHLAGVLLQEQAPAGVELLVGLQRDPVIGSALVIGLGGVHAELFGDVAVRPLPVSASEVEDMLARLKVGKMLEGWRGQPRANIEALVQLALGVAALGEETGEPLLEPDLNPVIVTAEAAIAVDLLCRLAAG